MVVLSSCSSTSLFLESGNCQPMKLLVVDEAIACDLSDRVPYLLSRCSAARRTTQRRFDLVHPEQVLVQTVLVGFFEPSGRFSTMNTYAHLLSRSRFGSSSSWWMLQPMPVAAKNRKTSSEPSRSRSTGAAMRLQFVLTILALLILFPVTRGRLCLSRAFLGSASQGRR